jgi:hypothetical protein
VCDGVSKLPNADLRRGRGGRKEVGNSEDRTFLYGFGLFSFPLSLCGVDSSFFRHTSKFYVV